MGANQQRRHYSSGGSSSWCSENHFFLVAALALSACSIGDGSEGTGSPAPTDGSSDGGSGENGGGSDNCKSDLGADELCEAQAAWTYGCGLSSDLNTAVQSCLIVDGALFDRFDPCFVEALITCFDLPCDGDVTQCQLEAIESTHPGLVDLEAEARCQQSDWNQVGIGEEPTSCVERHGGRLRECADAARACNLTYNTCLNATLLRDELLPAVDRCIAGPCDEFLGCLHQATFGER